MALKVTVSGTRGFTVTAAVPVVGSPNESTPVTTMMYELGVLYTCDAEPGRPVQPAFELIAPLKHHGCRASDDDTAHLLPHEQLPDNQSCLDRLTQSHVIRNKEVDPWKEQRLPEGFKLVGHYLDACTVRRLKQFGIGVGNTVPAKGVKIR